MNQINTISSEENVVRLLNRVWVENGVVLIDAFALKPKETYLSVNRPKISSFQSDVTEFLSKHTSYKVSDESLFYHRAVFNVGDVRSINVSFAENILDVKVEVSPRDIHTKSHAGIFVCTDKEYVKANKKILSESIPEGVSSDDILQEVQWALKDLATLEKCKI